MHLSPWRRAVFASFLASVFAVSVGAKALRIEDSDARIAYFPPPLSAQTECEHTTLDAACRGFWWKERDAAGHSLHYASGGVTPSLSLAFNGSAISLFGWRSKIAGAAYIAVDDTPGVFVNFTAHDAASDGVSALVFYRGALDAAAPHVLRLEYAGDGVIGIDYFEIEETASDSPINTEQLPHDAIDPSPSFPAFVTAVPLAIGVIALASSLLFVAYCWLSRRRMRVRPGAARRQSMSIDVPLCAVRSACHWYDPRRYVAPPDAPGTPRASSPGTPVDERAPFPTLSQIAGDLAPDTVAPPPRCRAPLRVYNPDRSLASTTEGSRSP